MISSRSAINKWNKKQSKKLIALIDGVPVSFHESIRAASIELNLTKSNITEFLGGKGKRVGKYTFVIYREEDYQY